MGMFLAVPLHGNCCMLKVGLGCTRSVCLCRRRVHNNNLTGSLPVFWGSNSSLPRLRVAALHSNTLTGTLPEGWGSPGRMQDLEELWLQVRDAAECTAECTAASVLQLLQLVVRCQSQCGTPGSCVAAWLGCVAAGWAAAPHWHLIARHAAFLPRCRRKTT